MSSNNCKSYSVEAAWNGGDAIFKESASAAGRTRLGTTESFIKYLNKNNVVVKDIAAGNSTGKILITYTDGTQKTVTVPA